jgi:hypothetical protein
VVADAAAASRSAVWSRLTAATHVASGRYADAIALLDRHLAEHANDEEARWLLLHALFGDVVGGASKDRFVAAAQRYVEGKGAHAELVGEWLRIVSTS